jgi:hypothetical protein
LTRKRIASVLEVFENLVILGNPFRAVEAFSRIVKFFESDRIQAAATLHAAAFSANGGTQGQRRDPADAALSCIKKAHITAPFSQLVTDEMRPATPQTGSTVSRIKLVFATGKATSKDN